MNTVTLGTTGITVVQNAFGALPIQRVSYETASKLLNRALDGGMNFIDTARAYSDSEDKIGKSLHTRRNEFFLATKTTAVTPEAFWNDLHTSLKNLQTDHIDIYQLHCAAKCYAPDDGTGLYECMLKAKQEGKILHIGITAHLIGVAEQIAESGLYETLQFPFCYLASDRDIALINRCDQKNIGVIAMKALSGGLITNARAAMAFICQFSNVVPIWGVQREEELEQFLSMMNETPQLTDEMKTLIAKDKKELSGEFCRGCGYCLPCPVGIPINNAARMIQLIRRAPSARFLEKDWQENMEKITNCLHCGHCSSKCPYGLDTPALLVKNLLDYRRIISGEIKP